MGDLDQIHSADRLAACAGLAPVANNSGKRSGRLHRPVRYNRALLRDNRTWQPEPPTKPQHGAQAA